MAKRRIRLGVFLEEGSYWYRLSTGGKVGPFDSYNAADEACLRAKRERMLNSPQARGNAKWTKF